MAAIYNEIEPYAAAWLGNLIAAGHIAPGEVDTRSIRDLTADDVRGDGQRHFFAGIGVWSHALRLAGWPDGVPVWTGSCPCQPFSAAGTGGGFDDDRHLWPVWFDLIRECRPAVVFGEQVASPAGLEWLDLVYADMEGEGYTVGAADLCSASVGAPHIRQRMHFVAVANAGRIEGRLLLPRGPARGAGSQTERRGETGKLADRHDARPQGRSERWDGADERTTRESRVVGELGDAGGSRGGGDARAVPGAQGEGGSERGVDGDLGGVAVDAGATRGFWNPADWIPCRDGKWRPVEPGTFPLAHGATARVGRLRAYGNAINPELTAQFIGSVMDIMEAA